MKPIIPINKPRTPIGDAPAADAQQLGHVDTLLPMGLHRFTLSIAALIALGTFGLATYFVIGFADTDRGFSLMSAATMCYGVGSLAYGPAAMMVFFVRRAMKGQWETARFWLALVFLTPWMIVALILVTHSAVPRVYGVSTLILTSMLIYWPIRGLIAMASRKKTLRPTRQ